MGQANCSSIETQRVDARCNDTWADRSDGASRIFHSLRGLPDAPIPSDRVGLRNPKIPQKTGKFQAILAHDAVKTRARTP